MYKTIPAIARETGLHRTTINKARTKFLNAIRETQEHRGRIVEIDTSHPDYITWLESRKRPITPTLERYEPNQGTYKPIVEETVRYMTNEEIAFVDQLMKEAEQTNKE